MTRATLISLVTETIPSLLDESGAVLYSRPETCRPGDYYILGLNPGGGEADRKASEN